MSGIIFDIQGYGLYDGPGIRTLVFFKGCPLRCAWCHNPESWRKAPEMGYVKDRCIACGNCIQQCSQTALHLDTSQPESGGVIVRNRKLCIVCGKCAEACEQNAMQVIGEEMTPEQVASNVAADEPFYKTSGGGATFTGGEATLQHEFLLETLDAVRAEKIHTVLETCGYFKKELLEELIPRVDLFLFDLKCVDEDRHKQFTGTGSASILENFKTLHHLVGSERIMPRIPLIPGFNADEESLQGIAEFLKGTGYTGSVTLMPYNNLAKSKWEKIGRGDEYQDMGKLSELDRKRAVSVFQNAGIEALVSE